MSLQGKHVLIIDDSEDVRLIERKILENLGLTVSESASVDDAMKLLDKKLPHLIILDLVMPVKSGFDFLTLRSQRSDLKGVPVIVASAHNDAISVHRALSLGADNFVIKPIHSAILGQRVRKHARSLDYMNYSFDVLMPDVFLQVKAQITGIGETSFTLGSPVRVAKDSKVRLIPPNINGVELSEYVLASSPGTSGRSLSGRYMTRINVMGLKETLAKQIKRKVGI